MCAALLQTLAIITAAAAVTDLITAGPAGLTFLPSALMPPAATSRNRTVMNDSARLQSFQVTNNLSPSTMQAFLPLYVIRHLATSVFGYIDRRRTEQTAKVIRSTTVYPVYD